MGTMKKHLGAYSVESSQLATENIPAGNNVTYIPCKATDGTNLSYTYTAQNSTSTAYWYSNTFMMRGLVPVATADKIADFNVNDYLVTAVGTTTYSSSRSVTATQAKLVYTITVTNSTENDIEISCIRFKKQTWVKEGSGTSYNVLCYSYYLDSPVTIAPGTNKVFSVEFNITVGS